MTWCARNECQSVLEDGHHRDTCRDSCSAGESACDGAGAVRTCGAGGLWSTLVRSCGSYPCVVKSDSQGGYQDYCLVCNDGDVSCQGKWLYRCSDGLWNKTVFHCDSAACPCGGVYPRCNMC